MLTGCASSYGRTSISAKEAHYARTVAHALERPQAFERVERALERSYDDFEGVLKARRPEEFSLLLEPTVGYRTGGPMGPARRSTYTLSVVAREGTVELAFELGREMETGYFAPEDAIPYIRFDFDAIVARVEKAVREP